MEVARTRSLPLSEMESPQCFDQKVVLTCSKQFPLATVRDDVGTRMVAEKAASRPL